jgi:hypothetical protein
MGGVVKPGSAEIIVAFAGRLRLRRSIAAQFGVPIENSCTICSHPVCLFLRVLQPYHCIRLQLQPYRCTGLQTIQGILGNKNFVSAFS